MDTTQPDVMVLDEPLSDLDLFAIRDLARVVQRWRDDGKTLVIAEHQIFYLLDLADRFIYIRDGRIEREFTPLNSVSSRRRPWLSSASGPRSPGS